LSAIFAYTGFVAVSVTVLVGVIVGVGEDVGVGVKVAVEVAKEAWAVNVAATSVGMTARADVSVVGVVLPVAQALSIIVIAATTVRNLRVFMDYTSILLKRFIVTLYECDISTYKTILAFDAMERPRKDCEQA